MSTNTNGLPELLAEVREAAELCEPARDEHTHATSLVKCARCGWKGDLDKAIELAHGEARCPECDELDLRTVPSVCTCGHTNTTNTEGA